MTCDCIMLPDGSQLNRRCDIHAKDYGRSIEDATRRRDGEWIMAIGLALQELGELRCPTGPDRETIYGILKDLRD